MAAASVENTVHRLLNRDYDLVTVVGQDRRHGFDHFRNTLHLYGAVSWNCKVLRCHMIGERPCVVCSIDVVNIDEGGVAAAVHNAAGVSAGVKGDGRAAVGDGR